MTAIGRFGLEVGAALCALPAIALGTRVLGPRPLVRICRRIGRRAPRRDPEGRARLARAIGAVDARLATTGRCYRRALAEMALDRGAAEERLFIGLHARGGAGSGHAWLESAPRPAERFDLELTV